MLLRKNEHERRNSCFDRLCCKPTLDAGAFPAERAFDVLVGNAFGNGRDFLLLTCRALF